MSRHFVPVTLGAPDFVSQELPLFAVTDARFPPDLVLSPHEHAHANIAVMLDGSFQLDIGAQTLECTPGTAFTEPAGERHSNRIEQAGAHVLVVQPRMPLNDHLRSFRTLITESHHVSHCAATRFALEISREMRAPDAFTPFAVEGLALEMMATLARGLRDVERHERPRWLGRAEEILRAALGHRVRTADIAAEVGVHPVHLARVFRRHHGMSMAAYLRRLRVDWAARELLQDPEESLASIALRAGFADQSHFTRIFRSHTGETPARYRAARSR